MLTLVHRFDDLILVKVGTGDNLKTYAIYSSTLTTRSLFFRKALSGPWKEAEERVVHLPEDNVRTFELYLHFIYNNEFACISNPPDDQYGRTERGALARLYVLCEKLQDPRSKNFIVKALSDSIYKVLSDNHCRETETEVLDILYKGTIKGSLVRRMVVDIFAQGVPSKSISIMIDKCPGEFLQELAACLITAFDLDVRRFAPSPCRSNIAAYLEEEEKVA